MQITKFCYEYIWKKIALTTGQFLEVEFNSTSPTLPHQSSATDNWTPPAIHPSQLPGYGDISMAVQAMQDGAYDFIEKPIDSEKLIDVVKRGMEKRSLVLDNRKLRAELVSKSGLDTQIIGKSPLTIELRENIANLADTNASVLVLGETGTGKDLVAQCLHEFSSRSGNNFVPVNCGAIPENIFESELFGHEGGAFTGATKRRIGRIEHSHRGTLFLDEIESTPRHLQVKLLRAAI